MSAPQAPKIVVTLLKASPALVAHVPVASMYPGHIPQSAPLPALAYSNVSDTDRDTISGKEATVVEIGRVQVTVAAADYPTKELLIGLVRRACANKRGLISGMVVSNVRYAGTGPDLDNEDVGIYGRTLDLLVTSRRARV
jgi:hypothetical protein